MDDLFDSTFLNGITTFNASLHGMDSRCPYSKPSCKRSFELGFQFAKNFYEFTGYPYRFNPQR